MEETKSKGREAVVRNYKDSVFRLLFREKEELLSLFNAINGTDYDNPEDLEINTLENAIYMTMKNDISCVLDMRLQVYEHQSTVNPNMPLRYLMYVGTMYEKMTFSQDIYSRKLILLPTPRFVVLYNGTEEQPPRSEMRLSDAFMRDTGEVNLELVVLQLNINRGLNPELKQKCHTLQEYTQYVERVRTYRKTLPLKEAVEQAVSECIREGILKEFLLKNRAEVVKMSIFEYNEELHSESLRQEGREEGRKEGRKEGREEGREEGKEEALKKIVYHMFQKNQTPEEVSDLTGEPVETVYRLHNNYIQMIKEGTGYTTEGGEK